MSATDRRVFQIGYNTNGLAHHRLRDALALLGELGYEAVAITPDVGELDPLRLDLVRVRDVRDQACDLGLALAVETGARFVLDPRHKHRPSLLEHAEPPRERRVDFLRRSIDLAGDLGAGVVSIWSGVEPDGLRGDDPVAGDGRVERAFDRLVTGVEAVLDHARERGVRIGFEPEPGMFVERPAGYLELVRRLGPRGLELGLTLDVGHLLVTGDLPVERWIRDLAPHLVHVHLDDIRGGVHEHRLFGEGDLDLPAALNALQEVGYSRMAAVELSRDSHRGAWAAERALEQIRAALLNRARP